MTFNNQLRFFQVIFYFTMPNRKLLISICSKFFFSTYFFALIFSPNKIKNKMDKNIHKRTFYPICCLFVLFFYSIQAPNKLKRIEINYLID